MPSYICTTCGVGYAETDEPREVCLICADDHDVQLAAQIMSHPYGMEIWDGERRVAALPPAARPAKAA